ncbi:GGDEF domain-containing protein [Granulicella aggregans]|uniref:GGDEF domain-containing protein n=1 Tax=Granulicella aggregans TaxID=474949 RepID=UPI001C85B282|nr:GGDEF domain-containing protein [Granulicella aggregans]
MNTRKHHSQKVGVVLFLTITVVLFFILEQFASILLPGRLILAQLLAAFVAAPVSFALKSRLSPTPSRHADTFRNVAENNLDDFYIFEGIFDAAGEIVDFRFGFINLAAERRLRTPREQFLGKVLSEVRPYAVSSGVLERYKEVVRTGVPYVDEIFIDDDTIHATWIHIQAVKIGNNVAVTSRDFTERKKISDHVNFLAHYDQLTGLPNRTLLYARLNNDISRARRDNHKVAVLMVDVDHFKGINDTLGHAVGDALLSALAKRLLASVRETDTVARLGGDEFIIVLPDFKSMEEVDRCAQKILEAVSAPINIGDRLLVITVSIGLCIYPDSGLEVEQILQHADTAMYTVKANGRNGISPYSGQRRIASPLLPS